MPENLQVAEGYELLLDGAGLRRLDDVFAWSTGQRLDKPGLESWRQRWRTCLAGPEGRERTVYLKRFDRPPLRRQWERWRSGTGHLSTAGVEWRNARDLARAGVRAAEAVAFGEQMRGPLEVRSCILLGEVSGVSLEKWVPAQLPPMSAEADLGGRRQLLDGLARFVARFHAAGFVHRDLYLCHIFFDAEPAVESGGAEAEQRFCLIDLQRVFRPKWRKRRWAVKDLAALDFSSPLDLIGPWERLRFLCRYVQHCPQFGSARVLARKIAAKRAIMTRRVESHRRRG